MKTSSEGFRTSRNDKKGTECTHRDPGRRRLLENYPEDVAKEYLKNTEEVLQWLRQNEKLKQ